MSTDVLTEIFNEGLPESISEDRQVVSIGNVSDIRWRALYPVVDRIRVLCNIDEQDEATIDLLAFQFGTLFYSTANGITDPDARLAQKKTLIRKSFDYCFRLGTPDLMAELLTVIYQNVTVQPWYLYGGTANHFRFLLDTPIDTTLQNQILTTSLVIKRASQTCDGFFVLTKAPEVFYVAIGCFVEEWLRTPVARTNAINEYLQIQMRIVANPNVNSSSQRITLGTQMTLTATPFIFNVNQNIAFLAPGMRLSTAKATIRVLLRAILRIGHG